MTAELSRLEEKLELASAEVDEALRQLCVCPHAADGTILLHNAVVADMRFYLAFTVYQAAAYALASPN